MFNFKTSMLAVLNLADPARIRRAVSRPCFNVTWEVSQGGTTFTAVCDGAGGTLHRPRIKLAQGKRTFGCDCQDHHRHLGRKGPCKHVISLALVGLVP